jgi:hypothetical protein
MALKFIEKHKSEPFFAYIPHLAPHAPLLAKEDLVQKYQQRGLGKEMATVFAMVEMVDDSVGRILDKLEELKLADNTIVIFMSDNGPQYFGTENCSPSDYAARYPVALKGHKGSMWENGIKVPFFVRLPEKFSPRTVERLADVQDVLPTLVELCGLQNKPEGALPMDGRSIASYLEGRDDLSPKTSVIFSNVGWPPVKDKDKHLWPDWAEQEYAPVPEDAKSGIEFSRQLAGLRTEEFKLLRNPGYAEGMPAAVSNEVLVNMAADPLEDRNLAAAESERTAVMRKQLDSWFDDVKKDSHAYAPPCFEIGPDTSGTVLLYAMDRRLGGAVNFGLDTKRWDKTGDGGEYRIHVIRDGEYKVDLRGELKGDVSFDLALDGQPLHQTSLKKGSMGLGMVKLPAGSHTLSITRSSGEGWVVTLTALKFSPSFR